MGIEDHKNVVRLLAERAPSKHQPVEYASGLPPLMEMMLLKFNENIDDELGMAFSHPSEEYAIRQLAGDSSLLDTFKHLSTFDLSYEGWWEIFFNVLVRSYYDVLTGHSDELEAVAYADERHLQDIASTAYMLFELLNNLEVPLESATAEVLEHTSIKRDLLELLSTCTSAKWPERYHKYWCQQDCAYYDSPLLDKRHAEKTLGIRPEHLETKYIPFTEVEKLRHEEMPNFYDREYCGQKLTFPPVTIKHDATPSKGCWDYLVFIEKAEYMLLEKSYELGRYKEPRKKGNYLQVTSGCRIFLRPTHWKNILICLFGAESASKGGSEKYQAKSINGAIRRAHENFHSDIQET